MSKRGVPSENPERHVKTRRSVNDNNPRRPRLVNEHACFLIWPDFCKFFGLQRAKIGPIFLKINRLLSLAPMSDIPRLEVNRLRNFDFIGRKPKFGLARFL